MVDNLCLLYVAMTRAKHRMDVVLTFRKKGAPFVKTLGAILRHALLTEDSEPDESGVLWAHEDNSKSWLEESPEETEGAAEPRPDFALAATTKLRRMPRRAPSALESGDPVDAGKLFGRASGAAHHGVLVHRLFEEVHWLEDFERSEEELSALFEGGDEDAAAQARALETFRSALERPAIKELLAKESQDLAQDQELEVSCEREFRLILDDDDGVEFLANGIIDRLVVRSRDGQPISAAVIDYKSDAVDEAGVSDHAQGYEGQMGVYRKAVSKMYGLDPSDVTLQLAFTSPGVVHDLP
jgi:ATP-dependent exoDNAse (exonuclease V) beta subunit